MAWQMRYGFIPEGMMVLHKCNNPSCVNVDHLYLGNHDKNMADRMAAGNYKKDDEHPRSVVTPKMVYRIMEMKEKNDCQIGRELGISRDVVRRIRLGRSWTKITGGPLVELGRSTGRPKKQPAA